MRVRRFLLLVLLAVAALPVTASSHQRTGREPAPRYRIGLGDARVVWLPRALRHADPDGDGLSTWTELRRTHTNPYKFDTDGDGFGDGAEVRAGTNPRNRASFPNLIQPPSSLLPGTPTPGAPTLGVPTMTESETSPPPPPDTTPPDTTIDSGTSGTTTSTNASFSFSSSEGGSTFQCRLDSASWSACAPPKSYNSLAVGAHTFSVRATDTAGNTDATPATRSWNILDPKTLKPCTETLSGGSLSSAISGAPAGAVLCLDGGSWSFTVSGVHKSSPVTVRPADGTTALIRHSLATKSSNLWFQGLNFTGGVELIGATDHIELLDNDFSGEFGIRANGEDASLHTAVTDVTIEGNTLHDLDFTGSEGVAGGYGMTLVNGVERFTIRDNTIESVANDYIQSASPVGFTVDGNTFLGPSLRYSHSSVHQDLWQIFGGGGDIVFTNNIARNTGTNESLLFQEGAFHNVQVENNLFVNDSDGYTCKIYQQQGFVFRDNTIVDSHWGCLFQYRTTEPAGSGYEVNHNIFVGTEDNPGISTESGVSHWGTFDYNVSDDGSADEPHSVPNWHPEWVDTTSYSPKGLPFAAGYSVP